jgi:3-hydroxybutyryl-CoA dehydrogenase
MKEHVVVVGAGQMGNGIAHVFAQAGFPVTMVDVSSDALARARATIEKNLARQVEKGTIDAAAREAALGRLSVSTELTVASKCALVVEAASEQRARHDRAGGCHSRHEHELDLDHADCRANEAA